MKITVGARIKTKIIDAKTNKVVKQSRWHKNMLFDRGINGLANDTSNSLQCNTSEITKACKIGSGNSPNSTGSGAITFTQSGNTITASGNFFTAGMVGALFKWGTGSSGQENYITGYTSATVVTVATAATVSTPDVATVWYVNKTGLDTFLYVSTTYQTGSGDCGTTIVGNTVTQQRTYIFPTQASTYTVNEIGYCPTSSANATVSGRIVLSSSDVIAPTNFYVVIIQFIITYTPDAPTAVGNVGTNWDSTGDIMIEWADVSQISTTTGASSISSQNLAVLDGGQRTGGAPVNPEIWLVARIGSAVSQNAAIGANYAAGVDYGTLNTNYIQLPSGVRWVYVAGSVGNCRLTFTALSVSTTGQTCYSVGIGGFYSNNSWSTRNKPSWDIKFATPQTLPVGTWQPTIIFDLNYLRTFTN